MIPLPVCRWRGGEDPAALVCRSPRFLGAPNPVRADFCRRCYYADDPGPAAALPPALPCLHLGGPAAGRGRGAGVFGCAVHGRCAPGRTNVRAGGPRACAHCPDYLPREPFAPTSAEMRARADDFLAALPDYPAGRFDGRGVVIAGGGDRYFASVYVTVRALCHVGCRLPVQVWYLGRNDEMPAPRRALLAEYGVECVDADAVRRSHPARNLNGWELKVFAILHAPFREVLLLDADCYPCRDPAPLFDHPDYRSRGAVFWPDVAAPDPRLRWAAFGVPDPGRLGSVESGQLLIDKEPCWRPLNLAWFYNDHSDYYYRHGYGDKHTFEVAWARCGTPFVMWGPTSQWVSAAYVHTGPDGGPSFVHRAGDKFRLRPTPFPTPQVDVGPAFRPELPLEPECWGWFNDLTNTLARHGGRPAPARIIRVGLSGHFNGSLVEYGGRLLLATRRGEAGARLFLSELGPDLQPRRTRRLDVVTPFPAAGLEDPRLFVHRRRLHCAFTAVEADAAGLRTHVMVARLTDDFRADRVWLPDYPGRAAWEKNWQFFSREGALYSVYSVRPHIILRHRAGRADIVATTAGPPGWPGQRLRGGAPPVRVGGEYYHFFHAVRSDGPHPVYWAGVYTFAARPPFNVVRAAAAPLLEPDAHDRPDGAAKSVVFPCGAVRRGGEWLVSYGYHDYECRVAAFDAAALERELRRVEGVRE